MKVLAINSSLRTGGESRSELLLTHLVEGMRKADAEVEVINLREYDVKYCLGCFNCWTKTPGVCLHKDDMSNILLPKFLEADIVVYATPLFHRTFTAPLKTFIERTLPASLPYLESNNERTNHPIRGKVPNFVVLSVAGFPEMEEFQLLSDLAQYNFNTNHSRLLAEIYRPSSQVLTNHLYEEATNDILDAVSQAGQEIIQDGKVASQTMARITQPLQEKSGMIKMSNMYWQTCIDNKITPKQFEKKGLIPHPKTVEDMMMLMSLSINSSKEKTIEIEAKIQFILSGERAGAFFIDINKGTIASALGETDHPAFTIKTPFKVWRDIMEDKADGTQMLMEGKYLVEGDTDLFINLFAA